MLTVTGLKKYFPIKRGLLRRTVGQVQAVDDVSFTIEQGRSLALVGESGSGKTTVARCLLKLEEVSGGSIRLGEQELTDLDEHSFKPLRRRIQYVFQDPYSSLNPRMTVRAILSEPLRVHKLGNSTQIRERVAQALEQVGLDSNALDKYPHEFSGGQRQRICIARSLVLDPEYFILDEPVSALDVSIQAQILNLLQELQSRRSLTYLFISHDLAVVRQVTDHTAVLYLGKLMEIGPTDAVLGDPRQPYTLSLLQSVPGLDRKLRVVEGEIPSNINRPTGCPFFTRCPLDKDPRCNQEFPPLEGSGEHRWACWVTGKTS